MSESSELIFYIVSLISLVGGIILSLMALTCRTEQAPRYFAGLFNPRFWRPVWKTKQYFTSRGFKLYVTGTLMIVAGALLYLVKSLILAA